MNVLLLSVSIHCSIVVPTIVNAQGKSQLLTQTATDQASDFFARAFVTVIVLYNNLMYIPTRLI